MFHLAIQEVPVSRLILTGIFLLLMGNHLSAQLSSQRADLERELRVIDVLLIQIEQQPGHSEPELAMINRQISLRERLLALLGHEVLKHEQEIGQLDDQICLIEESTEAIKKKYAESVRVIYSLRKEDVWLSVLSSGSLNEAFHKIRFFRQLSRYQRQQIQALAKATLTLRDKQQTLSLVIAEKESLREMRKLEADKLRRSVSLRESVAVPKRIGSDLSEQQATRVFLRETIKHSAASPSIVPPAPQGAEITGSLDYGSSFQSSRGTLPWPINKEQLTVIHEYGRQEDAFGNSINNNGITLLTTLGQEVFAVHSGVVTAIQRIPNGGSVVIIAHGTYRSVYAGLSAVEVELNQTVAQQQQLGLVYTDSRTGSSSMEFMIYLEPSRFLDPQKWLH